MPRLLSEEEKSKIYKRLSYLDNLIKVKAEELAELRYERNKIKQRTNWYRKYSPSARRGTKNERRKDM